MFGPSRLFCVKDDADPHSNTHNSVVIFELSNPFSGTNDFSKYNFRKVDFSGLYTSSANIDWTLIYLMLKLQILTFMTFFSRVSKCKPNCGLQTPSLQKLKKKIVHLVGIEKLKVCTT